MQRILLRSGKSPFDVVPLEEALHRDVIATNSGNLIFSDATHKILQTPGTEVVSNGIRTDVAAAERINEEYDVFAVPLANAFRPSFEPQLKRLTRLISRLRIPVVVIGVGAQAGLNYNPARLKPMERSVRAFVSAVLDRSASIGVRGEFTESYLRGLGFQDVDVIGCPSLFMHGKDLAVVKERPVLTADSRIAVNGSHGAMEKQGLDRQVRWAHARYPRLCFIGQNISDARQLHWRDLSHPNAAVTAMPTHPGHPMYREDKVRVYIDPLTWIEDLRAFDFSYGSRIHGNIAALLAGTPATVLCGDSRTLELCRYFEIPHRRIDELPGDLDPAALYENADFSGLTGGHGERFERFTAFLDRNGLTNTFSHGDSGAAFEARLRSLDFPAGVAPWNETDIASLSSRFGWLQNQISELSLDNARLRRDLERGGPKTRTRKSAPPAAKPQVSVYRRARRVVGRPIRRAFRSGRQ
ncbi:polysaccharide pyruvyl transferase family protein [Streptomyces sp. NPDC101181]|uniref:polysaccharide pyruvyl transferase family protein n=1 Tax=Streptomyces sp. NPDC101181 TaxID=3366125 RepID=UPI003817E5ED